DLRHVVGPDECGAGAVRTMDDDDRLRRQLGVRIELSDCRVVPGLDLTEENLRKCRSIELEFTRLDAFDIDYRNITTDHGRKLDQAILVELPERKRHVASTEGYGTGLD